MDHQGSRAHLLKMVLLQVTEVTWCTLIFFFEVPISEWDVLLPESIHLEFSEQILLTQCNKRTSSPKSQSSNIFLGVVIGNAPFSSIDINEITYYIQG